MGISHAHLVRISCAGGRSERACGGREGSGHLRPATSDTDRACASALLIAHSPYFYHTSITSVHYRSTIGPLLDRPVHFSTLSLLPTSYPQVRAGSLARSRQTSRAARRVRDSEHLTTVLTELTHTSYLLAYLPTYSLYLPTYTHLLTDAALTTCCEKSASRKHSHCQVTEAMLPPVEQSIDSTLRSPLRSPRFVREPCETIVILL